MTSTFSENKTSIRVMTWRILTMAAAAATLWPIAAEAQPPAATPVRRQFLSVSYDWLYTWPLHFAEHPLADLVGADVGRAEPQFRLSDPRRHHAHRRPRVQTPRTSMRVVPSQVLIVVRRLGPADVGADQVGVLGEMREAMYRASRS